MLRCFVVVELVLLAHSPRTHPEARQQGGKRTGRGWHAANQCSHHRAHSSFRVCGGGKTNIKIGLDELINSRIGLEKLINRNGLDRLINSKMGLDKLINIKIGSDKLINSKIS